MDKLSEAPKTITVLKTENISKEVPKHDFETEIIKLPSKGILYSKESGLSDGTVEMRYMTAADEDILLSKSLVTQGIAIDRLLRALIVSKINYDSLLIGDRNALTFSARIMGYGKDYNYAVKCGNCGHKNNTSIDLTKLPYKELNFDLFKKGNNSFEFKLPYSEKEIVFKLLTQADSEMISTEIKKLKQFTKNDTYSVDPIITTRLIYSIVSIDGKIDKGAIRSYVKNEMRAGDSRALRTYMNKVTPDLDYSVDTTCTECGTTNEVELVPDVEFFWPET